MHFKLVFFVYRFRQAVSERNGTAHRSTWATIVTLCRTSAISGNIDRASLLAAPMAATDPVQ